MKGQNNCKRSVEAFLTVHNMQTQNDSEKKDNTVGVVYIYTRAANRIFERININDLHRIPSPQVYNKNAEISASIFCCSMYNMQRLRHLRGQSQYSLMGHNSQNDQMLLPPPPPPHSHTLPASAII